MESLKMGTMPDRVVAEVQRVADLASTADAERLARRLWDAGLLRAPHRLRAEHGTPAAYERCRKRPEGSCEECKAAKRAYVQQWLDRRDPGRRRRQDRRVVGPRTRTPLPGGGVAEQEWNRLSDSQRKVLTEAAVDRRVNPYRPCNPGVPNYFLTRKSLERKGLIEPAPGPLRLTPRGNALLSAADTT